MCQCKEKQNTTNDIKYFGVIFRERQEQTYKLPGKEFSVVVKIELV